MTDDNLINSTQHQPTRPCVAKSELTVTTAPSWHRAASIMARGLRAMGIRVDEVLQDTPEYDSLGFVHPGIVYRSEDFQSLKASEVFALTKTRSTKSGSIPFEEAAAALMRDDVGAFADVWQRVTFDECDTISLLCCAAAVGAEAVLQKLLGFVHGCKREGRSIHELINRQDGEPLAPGGEPLGNSPLHYATMAQQPKICELLLAAGADPNLLNAVDTVAIHDASRFGSPAIAELLHGAGAALHVKNVYGDTAIHRVAEFSVESEPGYLGVYNFYRRRSEEIEAVSGRPFRSFINETNKMGVTALDMATARRQESLTCALKADGAEHSEFWGILRPELRTYDTFKHTIEWQRIQAEWDVARNKSAA